jgi:hypothetical protein
MRTASVRDLKARLSAYLEVTLAREHAAGK